jgi:CRISPR-associated protein Cmr5
MATTMQAPRDTARLSLEQQRAQHAWSCVAGGASKDYVNVAKAMPQLVMNSGLMQTLAFMEQKKKADAYDKLAADLRTWLSRRFNGVERDPGFAIMMQALLDADPQTFRLYTVEAFAWLKWLRQFAAAQEKA